jgi:hypothetical protein
VTSKEPVWLDITGAYGTHADAPAEGTDVFKAISSGPKGHEDKDGVEHYNDRVTTRFGLLGKLKATIEVGDDGQPVPVIKQADDVVLISRRPLEQWTWDSQVGVTLDLNPFGFRIFELKANPHERRLRPRRRTPGTRSAVRLVPDAARQRREGALVRQYPPAPHR